MRFENLTLDALRDFDGIVDTSLDFGPSGTRKLIKRLTGIIEAIGAGRGLGHRRSEQKFDANLRFANTSPYPFVVVYDDTTCTVLRILHGRRDVMSLVGDVHRA